MMMSLVEEHGDYLPPIVKTVASRGEGIEELDDAIVKHRAHLESSGELVRRDRERVRIRIETMLKEKFMSRLMIATPNFDEILDDVVRKRSNPHDAAENVLRRVTIQSPPR